VSQLRLAGPYVAWLEVGPYVGRYSGNITVADVSTGAKLATFKISGAPWGAFDIDAQGNIVAVHGHNLLAFTVKNAKKQTLSKRAMSYLATAGGRIAYVSTDAKGKTARSLNLIDFKGKVVKRLYRYGTRVSPIGDLALTDTRAAWSITRGNKYATATGSVFTEAL